LPRLLCHLFTDEDQVFQACIGITDSFVVCAGEAVNNVLLDLRLT